MAVDDAFTWWEDKQVAVEVAGVLVRGWVLSCRRVTDPTGGPGVGRMTIVLLIGDPRSAPPYPDTVVVDVLDDGGHGRPRHVHGLWSETDLSDVRTLPSAAAARPVSTANLPNRGDSVEADDAT